MTLADIIENLDGILEGIDEQTQIPRNERYELRMQIDDILDKMSSLSDEYGDDPNDSDEENEDCED